MSAAIDIRFEEHGHRGRYEARVPGIDTTAELTYSRMNEHAVIADHTGVPDTMRGLGVGAALVQRLIADAREHHFRIVPVCPYVKSQFARHPEWADVLHS